MNTGLWQPGTKLRFMIVLDHPVTDGADYDGDGGPDPDRISGVRA